MSKDHACFTGPKVQNKSERQTPFDIDDLKYFALDQEGLSSIALAA